ncbi:MAG: hypothetical protein HKN20_04265, partial [Gemmatimonadetes bacterium]|nr:hypothetical protein [Gemmatimonadota bacterium]
MKRRNWQGGLWFLFIAAIALGFSSCGDDNDTSNDPMGPNYPDGALVAEKVTTAPAQNASIDALWAGVEGIDIATIVPTYDIEVGGEDIWWDNYEGEQMNVNLKAVYTDTHLY